MCHEGPCFITHVLEECWEHTVTIAMRLLSVRHYAYGGGAATQQVQQDHPAIFLLLGNILIEGAFRSYLSVT